MWFEWKLRAPAHIFPRTISPGRIISNKEFLEACTNLPEENKSSPNLAQELYQEPAPLPSPPRLWVRAASGSSPNNLAMVYNSTSVQLNGSLHRQMHSIGIRCKSVLYPEISFHLSRQVSSPLLTPHVPMDG